MKINYLSIFVVILLTIGCTNDLYGPEEQSSKTIDKTSTNSLKGARVIPDGFELQWNDDGRWYGFFAGAVVWFWGPTPTQLENGIQGEWPITCQPYGSSCMNSNYTATGDGSFFTVYSSSCGSYGSTTIDMPTLSAIYNNGELEHSSITWGTQTRTIQTFYGGNCSLEAYGKIIINEYCKPTIVDYSSTSVSLCDAVYVPPIE